MILYDKEKNFRQLTFVCQLGFAKVNTKYESMCLQELIEPMENLTNFYEKFQE